MILKSELYIGAVMLDPAVLIKYPVPVDAIDTTLQTLFIELQKRTIENKPIDPLDIWLDNKGKEWADPNLLVKIQTNAITPYKAKFYAENLLSDYRKNKFLLWLEKAKTYAEEGNVEQAESELIKLYSDTIEAPYQSLEDATKDWDSTAVLPRIELGVKELDKSWLLDKGGFHIVAGRPGMGKTSYLLFLLQKACMNNTPTLFFSLEMPKKQILDKLYSDGSMALSKKPFYLTDAPAQTIEAIFLKTQLAKKHHNIGLIAIDYLQLVRTKEKFHSREQQVAYISSTCKHIAKQLDIPVIACCQLNREMETSGSKRPTLANLRESGSLEQDADSVSLLYRPEYYYKLANKPTPDDQIGVCELIIAKQRNAPTDRLICDWAPDVNTWDNWRHSEIEKKKFGQINGVNREIEERRYND